MISFCGQDRCQLDGNGRLKFSPRSVADFRAAGGLDVVLHCLPEGAVAVYPEGVFKEMRAAEPQAAGQAASSIVARRTMRRFGAMSSPETISEQGRVTIPAAYREHAGIDAKGEILVVGCEIGLEIWNPERWAEELKRIDGHVGEKGEREMCADLLSGAEHHNQGGAK